MCHRPFRFRMCNPNSASIHRRNSQDAPRPCRVDAPPARSNAHNKNEGQPAAETLVKPGSTSCSSGPCATEGDVGSEAVSAGVTRCSRGKLARWIGRNGLATIGSASATNAAAVRPSALTASRCKVQRMTSAARLSTSTPAASLTRVRKSSGAGLLVHQIRDPERNHSPDLLPVCKNAGGRAQGIRSHRGDGRYVPKYFLCGQFARLDSRVDFTPQRDVHRQLVRANW